MNLGKSLLTLVLVCFMGCAAPTRYHDPNMDFGSIQSVAVLPFQNLATQKEAGERVRDVFMNMLLSTEGVYVLPPGEVARGVSRAQLSEPTAPSVEEVQKLGNILTVDAVVTGVLREYGEVRSGTASSSVISLSLKMIETKTGKVIWTASSTKGGISTTDRLFGGGGQPMNPITEEAVSELIHQLFR
ncbi:MAG: GNA1162 family protein [bacterium]